MRFGIFATVQTPAGVPVVESFEELLAQVRLARSLGFDSVFAGHHYLAHPYQMLQPIPLLARLAAEAGPLATGTGVLLLPLLHPVDVAEQTATLDVISGGKLIVGVGLGYREAEYKAFGVKPRARVSRFVEALTLVKRLWAGEAVEFKGRHFELHGAALTLRPLQRPHPPVWVAANNDGAVVRAAEMGDAWFVNPHVSTATLRRQLALYREALGRCGKPLPREMPILRELCVAPSSEAAFRVAKAYLEEKYRTYSQWGQDAAVPAGEDFNKPFEELAAGRFIIGGPEECTEQIAELHEDLGFNHFVFRMQWPGMSHSQAAEAMRLLGERVIPYFKESARQK